MILVDTSVWIDFLNGVGSEHQKILHILIEEDQDICLTEIIVTEILQGLRSDKDFRTTKKLLLEFPIHSLKGVDSYVSAARIYRTCRKRGLTIRRPIDCLIAMVAIENDLLLLHKDRDFEIIATVFDELKLIAV